MEEFGNSPWSVNCLEDFLFYCCPECDNREHSREFFLQHAFEKHPEAKDILTVIIAIKTETSDFKENDISKGDIHFKHEIHSGDNYEELKDDAYDEIGFEYNANFTGDNILRGYQNHIKLNSVSQQKAKNNCNICGKYFSKLKEHRINCLKKLDVPSNVCNICGKDCKFASKLAIHEKTCQKKLNLTSNEELAYIKDNKEIDPLRQDITESVKMDHIKSINGKISTSKDSNEVNISDFIKVEVSDGGAEMKTISSQYDLKPIIEENPDQSNHNIQNKCLTCDKVFYNKHSLKLHIEAIHEGKKSHKCEICGKLFALKGNLRKHKKIVHEGIKEFKCDQCEKTFSQASVLKSHSYNHDKTPKKCSLCDKIIIGEGKLLRHMKVVHTREKFDCEFCGKTLKGKQYLKMHIQTVHEGQKLHKCETCGKDFSHISSLKVHIRTVHEGQRDHKCEQCGKKFTQLSYLKKHIKVIHEGHGWTKNIICEFCSKAFDSKHQLKKHVSFHHDNDPSHKCHLCGKVFENVKKHIATFHEGIKNVECDKCGKCFNTNSELTIHIKGAHEGGYKCELCGKCFSNFAYLKHHISSVHEGKKKFSCEHCEKTFAHKEGMKCHIKTVHEGIRYQCDYCEKSFSQSYNLKVHVKSHNLELL